MNGLATKSKIVVVASFSPLTRPKPHKNHQVRRIGSTLRSLLATETVALRKLIGMTIKREKKDLSYIDQCYHTVVQQMKQYLNQLIAEFKIVLLTKRFKVLRSRLSLLYLNSIALKIPESPNARGDEIFRVYECVALVFLNDRDTVWKSQIRYCYFAIIKRRW